MWIEKRLAALDALRLTAGQVIPAFLAVAGNDRPPAVDLIFGSHAAAAADRELVNSDNLFASPNVRFDAMRRVAEIKIQLPPSRDKSLCNRAVDLRIANLPRIVQRKLRPLGPGWRLARL